MQLWVAKELPPSAMYTANNVLIAARLGEGAAGIRNADHSGDCFLSSDDPALVASCGVAGGRVVVSILWS